MDAVTPLMAIVFGLVLLLAGKRVIWLAAALAAYLFIYPLLAQVFEPGPSGMIIAGLIGLVLAWLAVRFIQTAGFLVGALVGAATVPMLLGWLGVEWAWWIMALIGAVAGLILVGAAFDWGLILATAWFGASLVARNGAELLGLDGPAVSLAWIVLLVVGIATQARWGEKR